MPGKKRRDRSSIKGRQIGVRFSQPEYDALMMLVDRENERLRAAGMVSFCTPSVFIRSLVADYAARVRLMEKASTSRPTRHGRPDPLAAFSRFPSRQP